MLKYYLDFETNGFGGDPLSMGLVCEDDRSLYLVAATLPAELDPWVRENVVPYFYDCPVVPIITAVAHWGDEISDFIYGRGTVPQVLCDWPYDIELFTRMLSTGDRSVHMDNQTHMTIVRHIDVYPTDLPGAVRHNSWWDAKALQRYIEV